MIIMTVIVTQHTTSGSQTVMCVPSVVIEVPPGGMANASGQGQLDRSILQLEKCFYKLAIK